MSDEENAELEKKTKNCGMTVSGYLRSIIMNVRPMRLPTMEYDEILNELRSLGVNMNQLAAKAHTLGFIDEPKYRENADRVWNICGELAAQLVKREKIVETK